MFLFDSLPATVNDDIGLLLLDEVQIWVEHLLKMQMMMMVMTMMLTTRIMKKVKDYEV